MYRQSVDVEIRKLIDGAITMNLKDFVKNGI